MSTKPFSFHLKTSSVSIFRAPAALLLRTPLAQTLMRNSQTQRKKNNVFYLKLLGWPAFLPLVYLSIV